MKEVCDYSSEVITPRENHIQGKCRSPKYKSVHRCSVKRGMCILMERYMPDK